MEVVGVVASGITLLGAAVKGTEILHQIVSGFKDASSHAESLDTAIKSLRSILMQLKNNEALAADITDLDDFKELIKQYDVDIERFKKDLEKFQVTPKDSRTKSISKKLKGAILGDKNFLRVLGQVTQRCTSLGTQLSLLQHNTTLSVKDKVLELNAASLARVNHDVNQSKLLLQQSADLSAIQGTVENVQASMGNLQEAFATFAARMEQIPQVSRTQSEDIQTLLLALQGRIPVLANQSTNLAHTSDSQPIPLSEKGDTLGHESGLIESVERLKSLALEKEGDVRDEAAESLISDLGRVLHAVLNSLDNRHVTSSKRKLDALSETEDISVREMKRVCNTVASSQIVSLNTGAPRSKPSMKQKIIQKHKTKQVTTRRYNITITMNERRFSNFHDDQNQHADQSAVVETFTRIKLVERSESPSVITTHFRHILERSGFFSLNPVISIGKTLPDQAPVFDIVQRGDVDELKRLLARSECTLRDRDSFGTPFLHYAMQRPAMCKFLVDHGADVDEVALSPSCGGSKWSFPGSHPPLSMHRFDYEANIHELQDIIECRRILLQSGADPIISSPLTYNSFQHAIQHGIAESIKVLLDFGAPFISINERDEKGDIPLLLAAMSLSNNRAMRLKCLLDRGADIHARDGSGRTCLRYAINYSKDPKNLETEMEAISLLIQSGADIFTTDDFGPSIFDDVYECDHLIYFFGGYRGDLWDAVLAKCGYHEYIRKPEERICHYTEEYTHEHFARLWKGREHLCPYFFHPPRLCLYAQVYIGSDLDGNEDEDDEDMERKREEMLMSKIEDEVYLSNSEDDQSEIGRDGGVMLEGNEVLA